MDKNKRLYIGLPLDIFNFHFLDRGICDLEYQFVHAVPIVLSIVAVIIADAINYYLLDDEEVVPYYKLFGKTILKFKPK